MVAELDLGSMSLDDLYANANTADARAEIAERHGIYFSEKDHSDEDIEQCLATPGCIEQFVAEEKCR